MTHFYSNGKSLSLKDIDRIKSIFEKHKWHLDSENKDLFNYNRLFNDFCSLLRTLSAKEIGLIVSLTDEFLHCPFTSYPTLMRQALLDVPDGLIDKCTKVYVVPLIDPNDVGKAKSSSSMIYSCIHTVIPTIAKIYKKYENAYLDPSMLLEREHNRNNSLIILIDDFIGSGGTARKALKYYEDNIKVESDLPIIVSLVAQLNGVVDIEALGIKVCAAILRDRGITDSITIPDKVEAIRVMRDIERKMKVTPPFRLGYKKSEALVSMIRSPNNTFPLYWWEKNPSGEKWNGLFKRY